MNKNYICTDVNTALPELLGALLADGDEITSRAGVTKELMHVGITLEKPWQREILLADRKHNLAAQIAETMWILGGRNDVAWLQNYLPRAADFSDDGQTWRGAYGPRLRAWPKGDGSGDVIDQLRLVVDRLKAAPASRQAVAMIYDPARDSKDGKDIPCNNWLSFSSRLGKLDLHVAIRSNDAIWGWSGINQFEWSVVQEIVASLLGLEMGKLHFSVTSFHLYDHHFAKAADISRNVPSFTGGAQTPRFNPLEKGIDYLDALIAEWFVIEQQIRNGISAIHRVNTFPEPMMRGWLRILQWWWTGHTDYIQDVASRQAAMFSVQGPGSRAAVLDERPEPILEASPAAPKQSFADFLCNLHDEKHAAYGDSWKRRGEAGIINNIARKVDRLEGGETSDETSADTAGDLLVYLAKYETWLLDNNLFPNVARRLLLDEPEGRPADMSDETAFPNKIIRYLEQTHADRVGDVPNAGLIDAIQSEFAELEHSLGTGSIHRGDIVDALLRPAYLLAADLWAREQAV